MFRGQVESSQVFPFPIALDQEQIENVGAFVDPMKKFFVEVNDAARNDANAVSLIRKEVATTDSNFWPLRWSTMQH